MIIVSQNNKILFYRRLPQSVEEMMCRVSETAETMVTIKMVAIPIKGEENAGRQATAHEKAL